MIKIIKTALNFWFISICLLNNISHAEQKNEDNESISQQAFHAFSEAMQLIKQNYHYDVTDKQLIQAAIKGMVESLDDYSKYFSKEDFEKYNSNNAGEFVGIGIALQDHEFGAEIMNVLDGSPAAEVGLKSGMIITKIDNKDITYVSADEVINLLKGELGSSLELTVASSQFAMPKTFKIIRREILVASTHYKKIDENVGYLSINQFTDRTPEEFRSHISSNQPEMLIIDLRNNYGGVMESALNIADMFINKGKLLVSKGKNATFSEVYVASPQAEFADIKLVIMINEYTASSSEILAAALKDHKKAHILGKKSYGKGSIQAIFPLQSGEGIKITSAQYFTPSGKNIESVGIKPDTEFSTGILVKPKGSPEIEDQHILQAYQLLVKHL